MTDLINRQDVMDAIMAADNKVGKDGYTNSHASKSGLAKAMAALPAVGGWLDIDTAPKGEFVLIYRHAPGTQWHGRLEVAKYTPRSDWGSFNKYYPPTHWQSLPAPPVQP